MRVILMLLPAVLLAQAPAPATKPMTDEDKVVYSLGLSIYRSLGQFDLSPAELEQRPETELQVNSCTV